MCRETGVCVPLRWRAKYHYPPFALPSVSPTIGSFWWEDPVIIDFELAGQLQVMLAVGRIRHVRLRQKENV
jgi:hypothetical protein